MSDHDPMLDGITRWTAFESLGGLFQGMNKRPTGKYVLFSDLPALIEKVREDAVRDYAEAHYANKMQRSEERYEQGQRDEREAAAQRVEALRNHWNGQHDVVQLNAAVSAVRGDSDE